MSEFSNRVDAQRQLVKTINNSSFSTEQLFALNIKAIQRWSEANSVSSSSRIVGLLNAASKQIFAMANHSDDPIAAEYQITRRQVAKIDEELREELSRESS